MGQAGRDPLFYAQMTTANQDAANVGYFCMRCHVPMSFVTGHASDASGATMDATDRDGVNCDLCHRLVNPVYAEGTSPAEDQAILNDLLPAHLPTNHANGQMVLDPQARRRGPFSDAVAPPPGPATLDHDQLIERLRAEFDAEEVFDTPPDEERD